MTDYLEYGFKFILVYMALGILSVSTLNAPSIFTMISNLFFGSTMTDKQLPYYLEYGIDHNKYYNYIIIHIVICELCNGIVIFVHDLSFVIVVQHTCALLTITKRRLTKALDVAVRYRDSQSTSTSDEARRLMIVVIDIHDEALQLIDRIDDAYHLSWFLKLIETVIGSGGLLSIVIARSTDAWDFIRYAIYLIFTLVQFNVAFNRGQAVIDLSSAVFKACCDCEWDKFSKDSVCWLRMIMTRSSKTSYLTGGKVFILSNEVYGNFYS
ncbi:uncharacterized protein LOC131669707 isoform X2 [Phymastichus coffea]|uniref:uncharacterized protein LOC131669707 isoform X2 n=1 Tax=Phymastichus coffea TaxID=108790 RepID=UPI00273AD340|nr:uncharacterized protein LOC131669707 isoform X2 [Phymastichus coffea]